MNSILFKNELTESLCKELSKNSILYVYKKAEDSVMDDEITIWAGKRNGLKIVILDAFMYRQDSFLVVKTGFQGDKPFESTIFNGNSVNGVVNKVKRVLESFKAKRDFFLASKKVSKK